MTGSIRRALCLAVAVTVLIFGVAAWVQAQPPQEPTAARLVGTVKVVTTSNLILQTDTGAEVNVMVLGPTRIVRIAPGQTDLKQAAPVQLQDLKPGDRILVRGTTTAEGKMVTASSIVLMKAEDVAQQRERERQDWERRGIGGLVSAVDLAAGTIQLKTTALMGSHTVTVHTTPESVVRRYAPDSPKFDDAVRATLADVKVGDQLRARGTRNADGSELAAEEIVSGTFRNLAGLVTAIDPANNTVTINDLATKKPVTVKVAGDSLLHKLPQETAQRLAMMVKGPAAGGYSGAGRFREGGQRPTMNPPESAAGARPGGFVRNGNGAPSLQQMLSRAPAVALADLKKGEALMIVATSPVAAGTPTVITLLAGVEPILRASPESAMLLSPWNIGGGGGEGGGEGGPPN